MSVFISTTFMPNNSSVLEAIELLNAKSIFNIELGSIHRCEQGLSSSIQRKKCNYINHIFFPPEKDRFILNIASVNEHVRKRSLEFIKKAVDFAERINASVYTIHPGFLVDPVKESSTPKDYDFDFEGQTSYQYASRYKLCFETFLKSLDEIDKYIANKKLSVAVETQGSISKKNLLLLSRPQDFSMFLQKINHEKISINLNLGHLNLAANAWGFDRLELVEMLKPRVIAVEVSHNQGKRDEHTVLRPDAWYMRILKDDFFRKVPVVFEGRDLSIEEVLASYSLLCSVLGCSRKSR